MDEETRDRVLLKILESLDKIRQYMEIQAARAQGKIQPLPKRDTEIDELLGKRRRRPEVPLDDKI